VARYDREDREQLLAALFKALEEGKNGSIPGSPIFFRHGISASHGGKRVSLHLCFQFGFATYGVDSFHCFVIGNSQEPVFDRLLQKAGVPLAAKGLPAQWIAEKKAP
jgi:hypothetical protein